MKYKNVRVTLGAQPPVRVTKTKQVEKRFVHISALLPWPNFKKWVIGSWHLGLVARTYRAQVS